MKTGKADEPGQKRELVHRIGRRFIRTCGHYINILKYYSYSVTNEEELLCMNALIAVEI